MGAETPVFGLRSDLICLVSVVQRFTHDAWLYRRTMLSEPRLREADRQEFRERMQGWLKYSKDSRLVYDFEIVFDESVWPSSDEEAYCNLVVLRIRSRPSAEFYHFEINLAKPLLSCVSMMGPSVSRHAVNIFEAQFSLDHEDTMSSLAALMGR